MPRDRYANMTPKERFTRLVVVRNPGSTRARDEMGLVQVLEDAFAGKPVVELLTHDDDGKTVNWIRQAKQDELLGPRTLLAVLAGDGTMNGAVSSLLLGSELSDTERRSVILPLWGGNANDLARMLNGMPSRVQVRRLMRSGRVVAVHPIAFKLAGRGRPRLRLALCYASFGASAAVARAINASSFRRVTLRTWPPLRFVRELWLVIKTLSNAPQFRVIDGPDGRPRRIFERVILNGSRLAKVERVSLRLTDAHFYEAVVARMRLGALLSRALELSDRRFAHREAKTDLSFTVLTDILGQFDGEDVDIPANTTVSVTVHDTPFYALSLRLKD